MPFGPYDAGGSRTVEATRDVNDIIRNIAPTETPLLSSLTILPTSQVKYEWLTDTLVTEDPNNAMPHDGDAGDAVDTQRTLLDNYCQIFNVTASVNWTQRRVGQYGITDEMAYQKTKKLVELKRHIEKRILSNGAKQAGTPANTDTPYMDGLATQITVNVDSAGTFNQTTMTSLMQTIMDSGGDPTVVYCDSTRKKAITNFSGTDRRSFQDAREVINTVEVYASDFGELKIVYHRMLPANAAANAATDAEVLVLTPALVELREFEPFHWTEMARTGRKDTELGCWAITLANLQELGHGAFKGL